ncbi:MAG: hypothetical protein RR213_04895, partial [Raoultibacter sp.]
MNQATSASRCVKAAFSIILATSLVTGLVPVSAFADTSVKVTTAAPAQVSETVNIAGAQASGEGQPEGETATEGAQSPTKTSNQAASGQVKTSNQPASTQATASVALAADTTTVLDNGLVFVIDNATNTAAVTGWYGAQPTENLTVPAEIRHNGKLAEVNILG